MEQAPADRQPWENAEMRDLEKGFAADEELQSAARSFQLSAGVGEDRTHPKLQLDLTEEEHQMMVDIQTKVEQGCTGENKPAPRCSF